MVCSFTIIFEWSCHFTVRTCFLVIFWSRIRRFFSRWLSALCTCSLLFYPGEACFSMVFSCDLISVSEHLSMTNANLEQGVPGCLRFSPQILTFSFSVDFSLASWGDRVFGSLPHSQTRQVALLAPNNFRVIAFLVCWVVTDARSTTAKLVFWQLFEGNNQKHVKKTHCTLELELPQINAVFHAEDVRSALLMWDRSIRCSMGLLWDWLSSMMWVNAGSYLTDPLQTKYLWTPQKHQKQQNHPQNSPTQPPPKKTSCKTPKELKKL